MVDSFFFSSPSACPHTFMDRNRTSWQPEGTAEISRVTKFPVGHPSFCDSLLACFQLCPNESWLKIQKFSFDYSSLWGYKFLCGLNTNSTICLSYCNQSCWIHSAEEFQNKQRPWGSFASTKYPTKSHWRFCFRLKVVILNFYPEQTAQLDGWQDSPPKLKPRFKLWFSSGSAGSNRKSAESFSLTVFQSAWWWINAGFLETDTGRLNRTCVWTFFKNQLTDISWACPF